MGKGRRHRKRRTGFPNHHSFEPLACPCFCWFPFLGAHVASFGPNKLIYFQVFWASEGFPGGSCSAGGSKARVARAVEACSRPAGPLAPTCFFCCVFCVFFVLLVFPESIHQPNKMIQDVPQRVFDQHKAQWGCGKGA